jgi:hypothetical protein
LGATQPFGATTNPLGATQPFGATTNPLGATQPFGATTNHPATFGTTFKVPPVSTPTTFGAFESTNAFSLNKSSNNGFISQNNSGNIWGTIKSK